MPRAKERATVRLEADQRERLERLAAQLGTDVSSLLRAGAESALQDAGVAPQKPRRPWDWCRGDFEEFALGLTLPEGDPFRLEGHLRLVLREAFAPELVSLLVLLPKGNYKTTLFASMAVFHLVTVQNANCYIGAADKIQADEMYRFAAHFAESDPRIEGLTLVRRSTREIRSEVDQGFIRVLAADDSKSGGKRQGFNPTLALVDELHAHDNSNLYVDMRSGLFKRQGRMVTITTAGHDEESTLGQLRRKFLGIEEERGALATGLKATKTGLARKAKDGRLTVARTEGARSVMLEWASRKDDDLSDLAVVKLANPASGVTIESLEDAVQEPGITPQAFARYRCNRWVLGWDSWLPDGAWEALAEPQVRLVDGADTFAFIDMGRYRDCAALVFLQPREGLPAVVAARVWKSGGPDDPVAYRPIMDAIRRADHDFRLLACGFDPKYFDQASEELDLEGVPMVLFPQSNERMCPASANLREAIIRGRLRHNGDPVFQAHVQAGVMKDVGADQWRIVRPKGRSAPPVDACVALAGAHQLAFFRPVKPKPSVEVIV